MKKDEFITMYALNDNAIKTLERVESIKNSLKKVKDIDIKCDYETINNECDTKSARVDYLHIMYNKHNIIECYAKKNNTLYCLVRTAIVDFETLEKDFTVEKKSDKITRVIISDNKLYMLYSVVCKAIANTKTSATKKTSTTKKAVKKEA